MKTLVNKDNPAIRMTAPEIDIHEEEDMYLIPVSDYCIPMCIDDWALVEEEPVKEEIYPKCVHSGKDDGYCYYPYGGMRRRINENRVCECTEFCEKEQEQTKVNFKIEERKWVHDAVDSVFPEDGDFMSEVDFRKILKETARHFYELGLNARKK